MSTLVDYLEALEAALSSIEETAVWRWVPTLVVDYPSLVIMPPSIDYRQAMGAGVLRFDHEIVLLGTAFEDEQQLDLAPYLDVSGTRSVLAAVAADRTLGLADVDCVVMAARPLGLEEVGAYRAWGAAFQVLGALTNGG